MLDSKRGFTIVELLIVIVVIAVLAAITIVAYNGISNRAHDTAVSSDLSNLGKKLTLYKVDNDRYPTGGTGGTQTDLRDQLATVDMKMKKDPYYHFNLNGTPGTNILYIDGSTGSDFAVIARSKSMKIFCITSKNLTVHDCSGANASIPNFPGFTPSSIATSLGLAYTMHDYVYAPSSLRIWN